jgi:hypothetical protein
MSLVATLSACAPTADRWTTAGSTVEARDSAFASCRSTAHAQAASAPRAYTYQQVPAAGGVIGILVGALVLGIAEGAAKGVATNAAIDSCMREAGFARPQPAVNADGHRPGARAPDVNAAGAPADTRDGVTSVVAPGASPRPAPTSAPPPATSATEKSTKECGAQSTGPRQSLLALQPPPVSCGPKAGAPPS